MLRNKPCFLVVLSLLTATAVHATEQAAPLSAEDLAELQAYEQVITRVAGMVNHGEAQTLARSVGLDIVNVQWEDTGRYANSAVGPNISDVTISVVKQRFSRASGQARLTGAIEMVPMPVMRYPNFSDKTADLPIDSFTVLVGNEHGKELRAVALKDLLADIPQFLSRPDKWQGGNTSLLAARDTHILVSAQASFLPIPKGGTATFNPTIFNYQSMRFDPAVLVILATPQGTSMTIIDNHRDANRSAQRLFFNKSGQKAALTGQRMSDVDQPTNKEVAGAPAISVSGKAAANMVLMIQVPLQQWSTYPNDDLWAGVEASGSGGFDLFGASDAADVEEAVIGHGDVEGPFVEVDGIEIVRDTRFPIRATVQFYQATSNGILDPDTVADLAVTINKVYDDADFVGSLVTDAKAARPTASQGPLDEPADWWNDFWQRWENEQSTGRDFIVSHLRARLGKQWQPPKEQAVMELLARGLVAERQEHYKYRRFLWDDYGIDLETAEDYEKLIQWRPGMPIPGMEPDEDDLKSLEDE